MLAVTSNSVDLLIFPPDSDTMTNLEFINLLQIQSSPPILPLRSPPPPIPPPIFKSQIGFFLAIDDSFHRRFPNTAIVSSVSR